MCGLEGRGDNRRERLMTLISYSLGSDVEVLGDTVTTDLGMRCNPDRWITWEQAKIDKKKRVYK